MSNKWRVESADNAKSLEAILNELDNDFFVIKSVVATQDKVYVAARKDG